MGRPPLLLRRPLPPSTPPFGGASLGVLSSSFLLPFSLLSLIFSLWLSLFSSLLPFLFLSLSKARKLEATPPLQSAVRHLILLRLKWPCLVCFFVMMNEGCGWGHGEGARGVRHMGIGRRALAWQPRRWSVMGARARMRRWGANEAERRTWA
ncbi:hypothetical protein GOBAR_AA18858 [Gossypium barbadense]|uniref:Uncharacterized protein n=1 Tax=Gossypium barbadense TaxID=3634 RepID=A0A2P5XEN3_GOSBA|nr:hypothetical protein GOBAR_AA18858 [Gossypium barbadense]